MVARRTVAGWAALCGLLLIAPATTRADRGGGSIRAAGRTASEVRETGRGEPNRVEPRREEPARVAPEVRPEARAAPPSVRRDWDDHDVDVHHGGGFAGRSPVYIVRGHRVHDLPHYRSVRFGNRVYFCDDDGNYYVQDGADYVVVQPPIGVGLPSLPPGTVAIAFGPTTYDYADGIFYVAQNGGFTVVNPPPGIVVTELPTGAAQVVVNGNVCYQFNGFYYAPSVQDGLTVYTVTPA